MIYINSYTRMENKLSNANLYYDLNAMLDFVFNSDDARSSDVEITDSQVRNEQNGMLETETRIVREVKSNNDSKQNMRYDMLKTFIEVLENIEVDEDGLIPLSLGEKLVVNTMNVYGFLKESE